MQKGAKISIPKITLQTFCDKHCFKGPRHGKEVRASISILIEAKRKLMRKRKKQEKKRKKSSCGSGKKVHTETEKKEFFSIALKTDNPFTSKLLDQNEKLRCYHFVCDPLTHKGGISSSMLKALFDKGDLITEKEEMAKISSEDVKSVLIIHNWLDSRTDFKGSWKFFDRLKNIKDKQFLALNPVGEDTLTKIGYQNIHEQKEKQKQRIHFIHGVDVWHNIPNEPDHSAVLEFVQKWLKDRT